MTKVRPKRQRKAQPEPPKLADPEAYARLEAEVERRKALDKERGIEPRPRGGGEFKTVGDELKLFFAKRGVDITNITEPEFDTKKFQREMVQVARESRYKRNCPEKYYKTFDIEKTPASQEDVQMVLGWQYGPKGLFIIGETGRSKTWALWTLLHRLIITEGRSVLVMDGVQFANEASAAFGDPATTERWINRFLKPQVFVIDDLAKRFKTSTQHEALFAVLDRRGAKLLPFIGTTNCSGERLASMINDPELSEPLRRRMKENCQTVIF